ncbi:MAG: dienelactone hydrolase family protein [Candidatus Binatia bacterium]
MKTLKGEHEIYIYPNAGHGFAKSGRKRYNKEAAEEAWERTTAFLKKYL